MDKTPRELLIELLRTKKQCTGRLRYDDRFCYDGLVCGVHCKVTGAGKWIQRSANKWSYKTGGYQRESLIHVEVKEWAKANDIPLYFNGMSGQYWNDAGKSFEWFIQQLEAGK